MEDILVRLKNKNIKLIQLADNTIVINMRCELSDLKLDETAIKELQFEK